MSAPTASAIRAAVNAMRSARGSLLADIATNERKIADPGRFTSESEAAGLREFNAEYAAVVAELDAAILGLGAQP